MASSEGYVRYVCEQIDGAGQIRTRKMFGEYCVYCDEKPVGCICDDVFYLKPTQGGEALLTHPRREPPYAGAKPCLVVEDLENREHMATLVATTCRELPPPKPKRKAKPRP